MAILTLIWEYGKLKIFTKDPQEEDYKKGKKFPVVWEGYYRCEEEKEEDEFSFLADLRRMLIFPFNDSIFFSLRRGNRILNIEVDYSRVGAALNCKVMRIKRIVIDPLTGGENITISAEAEIKAEAKDILVTEDVYSVVIPKEALESLI